MMYVHVGDDTYGAIRWVGTTRVATVFRMASGLPLWPLQSVFIGTLRKGVLIPLDGDPKSKLMAVALPSVDRTSVWLTYVRAAASLLIIFGSSFLLVGLVMFLTGEQLDLAAKTLIGAAAASICLGVLIGVATYVLAPRASERERAIRLAGDEIFGLAADPARLETETVAYWAGLLEMRLHALGIHEFLRAAEQPDRWSPDIRRLLLMRVRAQIALCPRDIASFEQITDRLLPLVPEGREMVGSR